MVVAGGTMVLGGGRPVTYLKVLTRNIFFDVNIYTTHSYT